MGMLMSFLHLGVPKISVGAEGGHGKRAMLRTCAAIISGGKLVNSSKFCHLFQDLEKRIQRARQDTMAGNEKSAMDRASADRNNPLDYINSLSLLTQSLIACDEEGPYSTNNPTMKLLLSVGLWLPCTKYLGLNVKNRRLCGIS